MTSVPIVPVVKPRGQWFIELLIEHEETGLRAWYSLGPITSWGEAYKIAKKWEGEFGDDTTRMRFRGPDDARFARNPTRVDDNGDPLPSDNESLR